jgi:hypothetical protein
VALTNITNSFTPQSETIALYPFLGNTRINLTTPASQSGIATLIANVYQNLFRHTPDSGGASYWLGQISSGAIGLGSAILAIANGATGSDAIELQNKITVALDFTTRTTNSGIGAFGTPPASLLTAARTVLSNVDGLSLNDASVFAGENATTAYLNGVKFGVTTAATATDDAITISASGDVIDPGLGSHTIQFLGGAANDTLVVHAIGVDQISGFNPVVDVLDVRSLLTEANISLGGDMAALSNYFTVTDRGPDALLDFDPAGHDGNSTVAVLRGLGGAGVGLDMLIAHGSIRAA